MKQNYNHENARSAGPQLVPVRFEFTHPIAITISVAGTFNPGGGRSTRSARFASLADVVNHYDGHLHTGLTDAEKADLVAYLKLL